MDIRDFTVEDIPVLIELGKKMHKESSFAQVSFDEMKIREMALHYLANPEQCFARVASENNRIYAMYIAYISDYYFSRDLAGFDEALFVTPEKRGGIAAIRLVKEFETWAKAKGANELRPACSTGCFSERTKLLYEALGYEVVGYTFKKRI